VSSPINSRMIIIIIIIIIIIAYTMLISKDRSWGCWSAWGKKIVIDNAGRNQKTGEDADSDWISNVNIIKHRPD